MVVGAFHRHDTCNASKHLASASSGGTRRRFRPVRLYKECTTPLSAMFLQIIMSRKSCKNSRGSRDRPV